MAAALLAQVPVVAAAGDANAGAPLLVCADPDNLPFSNQRGEGFENRIAEVLAADLGLPLGYAWQVQSRSFLRRTLLAGECDVVMGAPTGLPRLLVTRPYYRSTYVFVGRSGDGAVPDSFDDPRLRRLRIGLHLVAAEGSNTPAAQALAARGITANITGYPLWAEASVAHPASRVIDAVARGDIDLAIVWGPFGGYFAKPYDGRLNIVPVAADAGRVFAFDIALAVRADDAALRDRLDLALSRERAAIAGILAEYAIPLAPSAP